MRSLFFLVTCAVLGAARVSAFGVRIGDQEWLFGAPSANTSRLEKRTDAPISGTGTCASSCTVASAASMCGAYVSYPACLAGVASGFPDPLVTSQSTAESNVNSILAVYAQQLGAPASAACRNEIIWNTCVNLLPPCASVATTSYTSLCVSNCIVTTNACSICRAAVPTFSYTCAGRPTFNCATSFSGNAATNICGVSGKTLAPPVTAPPTPPTPPPPTPPPTPPPPTPPTAAPTPPPPTPPVPVTQSTPPSTTCTAASKCSVTDPIVRCPNVGQFCVNSCCAATAQNTQTVEARINEDFATYDRAKAQAWIDAYFKGTNMDPSLATLLGFAQGSVIISYILQGTTAASSAQIADQMKATATADIVLTSRLKLLSVSAVPRSSSSTKLGGLASTMLVVAFVMFVFV